MGRAIATTTNEGYIRLWLGARAEMDRILYANPRFPKDTRCRYLRQCHHTIGVPGADRL
jgi:hypothetical protein